MQEAIVKKGFIRSEELKTYLGKDDFFDFIIIQQLILVYTELTPKEFIVKSFSDQSSAIHFIFLLRHIFVHFPVYSKVEDIYVTLDMLQSGTKQQGKLEQFLKTPSKSELIKFSTAQKDYYFTINIPILSKKDEGFKLLDIINVIGDELKKTEKLYLLCIILGTIFQNYCREIKIINHTKK